MARTTPRRRDESRTGGPGWGHVLLDLVVLLLVVGAGVWIAEAVDWQGSRTFRLLFFGVVLLGLVGGYALMTFWNAAHEGDRSRRSSRHSRSSRQGNRASHRAH